MTTHIIYEYITMIDNEMTNKESFLISTYLYLHSQSCSSLRGKPKFGIPNLELEFTSHKFVQNFDLKMASALRPVGMTCDKRD